MEAIGKSVLSVLSELTDSPPHSASSLVTKPEIRAPETVAEARALRAWAESQDCRPEPATVAQFSKHVAFMQATLPSKSQDEEGGKMRATVYASILREYSNDAIAFMARRACETLDWFPTPRQCIDILKEYRPPRTERETALMLCHRFGQDIFERFLESFYDGTATQAEVDSVDERWRRIAMNRGFLRLMPDGSYTIRERKAYAA